LLQYIQHNGKIWKIWKLNQSYDRLQYPEKQQQQRQSSLTEGFTPQQQPPPRQSEGGENGGCGFVIDFFQIAGEPSIFDSVISLKVLGI
jgi:hypothetical protein